MSASPVLWWQRGVVYQIYPRSWQDSNGDGTGDLAGVIQRLDHLVNRVPVDAVWLSPFFPSPMADFGYDVSNYTDVDPLFGDLATFDRLVSECHRRDIRVIIDWVPNHTSDRHPWFLESRSSRNNPKRDWYVWRDPRPDGSLPNNWLANFGGPAWEWDDRTHQYYLHSFLPEQPDLNWRNPEVRAAMLDTLRFWLDRGVDGFRIDVAPAIMKDPELRDNPPNPTEKPVGHGPMREYETQLHVHDTRHPDVHGVYREIRRLLDGYSATSPRVSIGETHIYDWPEWASYYGEHLDELHLPFNFRLLPTPWRASDVRQVVDELEAVLPDGAWPNWVVGNHDEHRIAARVGAAQARVAMMLLLTLRGTPTLYYGDELGMSDVPIPPEREQDPWGKRVPGLGVGRDPSRTPMQWDAGPNAGFCPPDVEPWLPLSDDYRQINVEVESGDPNSMVSFTGRLLRLRRSTPALAVGSYRSLNAPDGCFVYLREHENSCMAIALNFTGQPSRLHLDEVGRGRVLASTLAEADETIDLDGFELRGDEGIVVSVESR